MNSTTLANRLATASLSASEAPYTNPMPESAKKFVTWAMQRFVKAYNDCAEQVVNGDSSPYFAKDLGAGCETLGKAYPTLATSLTSLGRVFNDIKPEKWDMYEQPPPPHEWAFAQAVLKLPIRQLQQAVRMWEDPDVAVNLAKVFRQLSAALMAFGDSPGASLAGSVAKDILTAKVTDKSASDPSALFTADVEASRYGPPTQDDEITDFVEDMVTNATQMASSMKKQETMLEGLLRRGQDLLRTLRGPDQAKAKEAVEHTRAALESVRRAESEMAAAQKAVEDLERRHKSAMVYKLVEAHLNLQADAVDDAKGLVRRYLAMGEPFTFDELYRDPSAPLDQALYQSVSEMLKSGELIGPDPTTAAGNHQDWLYQAGPNAQPEEGEVGWNARFEANIKKFAVSYKKAVETCPTDLDQGINLIMDAWYDLALAYKSVQEAQGIWRPFLEAAKREQQTLAKMAPDALSRMYQPNDKHAFCSRLERTVRALISMRGWIGQKDLALVTVELEAMVAEWSKAFVGLGGFAYTVQRLKQVDCGALLPAGGM